MTGRQNLYVLGLYGTIILATVIGAVILGIQGTLDSAAITAIFGTAIGGAGAALAAQGTLGQAVNGKSTVSTSALNEREQTLRAAIHGGQVNPPEAQGTTAT